MNLEEIRRVTIQTSVTGADASAAALNKLAAATAGVTVASATVSKETLSAEAALTRLRMSIDREFASTERLAAAQKTLTVARQQGLISIAEQNKLMDLAATKYAATGTASGGIFASLGGVKALLGGLGIGLGIGELMKIPPAIASIVHEAAGLTHTADTIGITTKALQEFEFAGSQVHISTETMDSALETFSKNLGQAETGVGNLAKILKANHVQISGDFTKDLLSVANLVEHATNAEQRNLIITQAFGKNAQEMGLLFQNGGAGIAAASAEAERLGIVMSDDSLRHIEEIDKQFSALATTLSTKFKIAVLDSVSFVASLGEKLRELDAASKAATDRYNGSNAGLMAGQSLGQLTATQELAAKLGRGDVVRSGGEDDWLQTFRKTKTVSPAAANPLQKQFDDSLKNIAKQTAALRAQADTFGMTAGAAAEYEKRQELINLATENHLKLSPKELANVDAIAKAYGEATTQLQHMKDAAQAQQFLAQSLFDAVKGATSLSDAFAKLADSIATAVEQALLLGTGPLAGIFGTSAGGSSGGLLGSLFSGLFGGGSVGAPMNILPSVMGNVFANDNLVPFGRGGIVDHPTMFPFASGVGLMGEAGTEAIIPLKRGPDGNLGVRAGGGGGSKVVNNFSFTAPAGTTAEVKSQKTNSTGGLDIEVIIAGVIAKDFSSNGPASRAAEQVFSLNRAGGAR